MAEQQTVASAYDALPDSDKEAINAAIYLRMLQAATRAEQFGPQNKEEAASMVVVGGLQAEEYARQAGLGGPARTSRPDLSGAAEAAIETERELSAEDPARMQELRSAYVNNMVLLQQAGIPFGPREGTEMTDRIIQMDGDQFDVQKELPKIRARIQQDRTI